ncbi:MAG TPA: zinc ribbon domain-containing protein, partial [Candidatus Binatia bacterium]|nr:zinc ribbon domain-containing protein [Candidatus Binatia bacterium]
MNGLIIDNDAVEVENNRPKHATRLQKLSFVSTEYAIEETMADEHYQHHVHGHIEYRFCPRCGGDLEKRPVKPTEPKRLVCLNCSFIFYQDP